MFTKVDSISDLREIIFDEKISNISDDEIIRWYHILGDETEVPV